MYRVYTLVPTAFTDNKLCWFPNFGKETCFDIHPEINNIHKPSGTDSKFPPTSKSLSGLMFATSTSVHAQLLCVPACHIQETYNNLYQCSLSSFPRCQYNCTSQ